MNPLLRHLAFGAVLLGALLLVTAPSGRFDTLLALGVAYTLFALRGACGRDVTGRKQAERAVHESEERLRYLSDNLPSGMLYQLHVGTDGRRQFTHLSEAVRALHGCTPEEGMADAARIYGTVHEDDRARLQREEDAALATLSIFKTELRLLSRDHAPRWVELVARPRRLEDGSVLWDGMELEISERKQAEADFEKLHKELLDTSRQAGMAEVATSVLHNVGNVLNSANVSVTLVADQVRRSRVAELGRVVALLDQHAANLGDFMTTDDRGRNLPEFLRQLSARLTQEQEDAAAEVESLRENIEHIKEIVAMQQNYARISGVREVMPVAALVEDSLRLNAAALVRHEVEVVRDFRGDPEISVEKHKALQILVNLIRNAKHACEESGRKQKRVIVRVANGSGTVRISVTDNGIGIPAENLTRIFNHGFTTRKHGHGFGLHSGALAARELGGALTVESEGSGCGATFTLELPTGGACS